MKSWAVVGLDIDVLDANASAEKLRQNEAWQAELPLVMLKK